jgi:hypothetical protein
MAFALAQSTALEAFTTAVGDTVLCGSCAHPKRAALATRTASKDAERGVKRGGLARMASLLVDDVGAF